MNIVCIGAHPDDCEVFAGGTCAKWAAQGHHVALVSMTNGDIGHFREAGGPLALRRAAEAAKSAAHAGCVERILGIHDGELEPTLEVRKTVVRMLRKLNADIVLTHRPNDYHPDHRYTSMAVQDAAYMVTVPHFCPEMPRLERNPLFLFLADQFVRPAPFRADIAVDVDDVMDIKWDMMAAMESQFFEWLPWLDGRLREVPSNREDRLQWLKDEWSPLLRQFTEAGQEALRERYGPERGGAVQFAEVFEICEYGHQPGEDELRRLFPFFPGYSGA